MVGLPEITLVSIPVADPESRLTPCAAVTNVTVTAHNRCENPDIGQWIDGSTSVRPYLVRVIETNGDDR